MQERRLYSRGKKRRSALDKAIMVFLCLFLFCIIIGVTSLLTIIMSPKFNDGTLSSITGLGKHVDTTTTSDSSGKSHPALGYAFDGSKYVESSTVMDFYTQTISIWFYLTNPGQRGKRTLLSNRDSTCGNSAYGESNTNGYAIYIDVISAEEQYIVIMYSNDENACERFSVEVTNDLSQWTHLAIIFRRTDNKTKGILYPVKIEVYVNGEYQHSKRTNRYIQSSVPFQIGAFYNHRHFFIGCLASIMIYKQALTGTDIVDLSRYQILAGDYQEKVFFKLRPEVISERIGQTSHLLGVLINQDETAGLEGNDDEEEMPPVKPVTTKAPSLHKKKYNQIEESSFTDDDENDNESQPAKNEMLFVDNSKRLKKRLRNDVSDLELFKQGLRKKASRYLKVGQYHFSIPPQIQKNYNMLNTIRASAVKKSMQFLWKNYKAHAFGYDELLPVTGGHQNNWGGVGMTLVDSLDTLFLMDMKDDFELACNWIQEELKFSHDGNVSVFEYNIRLLGGLLSAYDLSKKPALLEKAIELGSLLKVAFEGDNPIPVGQINPSTHEFIQTNKVYLAEYGSLALEFRYLSHVTKDTSYKVLIDKLFDQIKSMNTTDGLFPLTFDRLANEPRGNNLSMGAFGDSFYEYLLKAWLQNGKKDKELKVLFDNGIEGMKRHLLHREKKGNRLVKNMQHLTCFASGMLALSSYHETDVLKKTQDLEIARSLAYTCYEMYHSMPTGLSPESVNFADEQGMTADPNGKKYLLRPEVIESFYVLYTVTKDPIYIEWGYEIFTSIEKHCKTMYGYGTYPDVTKEGLKPEDQMESFFPAETLKYLYLLFKPSPLIDFDKVVFNTECHPLKVFSD